jgi:hypothetical protein
MTANIAVPDRATLPESYVSVTHSFASANYARERLNPLPGDLFYLHLSDLLLGIKQLLPPSFDRVLDFGCGTSPYRPLFGQCTYHRADLAGIPADVDLEFGLDSRLPAPADGGSWYLLRVDTQSSRWAENPVNNL